MQPEPTNKITESRAAAVSKEPFTRRLTRSLWKLLSLVLLIALVVCVVSWKPWQANIKAGERSVTVNGSATIKAEPDEFVFYPSYTFSNADKQTAINEMTAKSNELVAKLKALGVPSNKIKTDSSGYSDTSSLIPGEANTYNLSLTVTVPEQALAQKVQDYLLSTGPSGPVSPQASFSTSKQKQLESQARDNAEKDARAKAEQSAKNLGFSVDKVKAVEDSGLDNGGGCRFGLCQRSNLSAQSDSAKSQTLTLQPGENELPYSVKVTYYIH